jgi:hypothetical protein
MKAEHGTVSTHAHTIFPATPHRTAESLFTEPTPTIAPVMVALLFYRLDRPGTALQVIATGHQSREFAAALHAEHDVRVEQFEELAVFRHEAAQHG